MNKTWKYLFALEIIFSLLAIVDMFTENTIGLIFSIGMLLYTQKNRINLSK